MNDFIDFVKCWWQAWKWIHKKCRIKPVWLMLYGYFLFFVLIKCRVWCFAHFFPWQNDFLYSWRTFLVLIRSIPQAPYKALKNGVFHDLCHNRVFNLEHFGPAAWWNVATVWTWTLNDASWVGNQSRYTVSVLQFGQQLTHSICSHGLWQFNF